MCKVSVVVPVYNSSMFLEKCIDSILNQDFKSYEIILIDDGSTDGSGDICDNYSASYRNIKAIHQKNSGVSSARNHGIEEASGKYICFIDSDDWVEPNYISFLYKNMNENGLSACNLIENQNKIKVDKNDVIMNRDEAQISVYSCFGMQGFPVCKMYDRNMIILNDIRFDTDIYICEDVLFNIKYLKYAIGKIIWNKTTLYHYGKMNSGATERRFKPNTKLNVRSLTEFEAINRSSKYINSNPFVRKAYLQRAIKAAGTTLRVFEASNDKNHKMYDRLLKFVRKNSAVYLFGHEGSIGGKISVLLTCISPRLEYFIWRKANG